ncbi:MAG TPA: hypothetical protein DCP98_04970 [Sphaerochaeta sp.]|nr:hypothetical protein [Sphaerochaeta sp.]
MKKLFCILLALFLLLIVVSCKQDPKSSNLPMGNGETVKVVILSGQSNASGCSRAKYLSNKRNYDNVFVNLHEHTNGRRTNGFVSVIPDYGCDGGFFGPEYGMANLFSTTYPSEKVMIIKYTRGGGSLQEQFLPSAEDVYPCLVSFVQSSLETLRNLNYNPEIVGFCWMQGESDAVVSEEMANAYHDNMVTFVTALRNDIQSDLKIFDAAINDIELWVRPDVVNNAKRQLASELSGYCFIDTNAAGLTTVHEPEPVADLAHYDSRSEIKLGLLFAQAVIDSL